MTQEQNSMAPMNQLTVRQKATLSTDENQRSEEQHRVAA